MLSHEIAPGSSSVPPLFTFHEVAIACRISIPPIVSTHTPPCVPPYDHKPLTVSTPLSTTALTLALSGLLAHSTSKSSNHTLATYLSNLISIPGTGIPSACSLFNSALSSADSSCDTEALAATENGASGSGVEVLVSGTGDVELRGNEMGDTAFSPNWASRKRQRRARRVAGSGVWWGWGSLKRWERAA